MNICLSSKLFRYSARKANLFANIGLLNPLGRDVNILAKECEIQPSIEQLALVFNNRCRVTQLSKIYLLLSSMISLLSRNFSEKISSHSLNNMWLSDSINCLANSYSSILEYVVIRCRACVAWNLSST